ncbi:hypothetical protein PUMCH_000791 [Australozyma saopauloensis]|uniref:Ubiquitin carboxyl-terminal hydrolase n=1 Tax=Australozyma saopauloensis TaxID=291208 RepID=A0AAX4H705_9ASCO|nr:hypothetical protein PUMCH_000791 [[Candida] saopauloensis]
MTTEDQLSFESLLDIATLNHTAEAVAGEIIEYYKKPVNIINVAISLLEMYKHQTRKLDKLGYCDYSMAYVCYRASGMSAQYCLETSSDSTMAVAMAQQLLATLRGVKETLARIKASLSSMKENSVSSTLDGRENWSVGLRYSDFISVEQLDSLVREHPLECLLLDFRTPNEFAYSHLNFLNVVNIPPMLLSQLLKKNPEATDADLEQKLSQALPYEMSQLFKNRHTYSVVVLYNLRYGLPSIDKFRSLKYLEDKSSLPKNSPFKNLIDILIWKNQYISSRLKMYPLILDGGMSQWHHKLGDKSIVSSASESTKNATKNTDQAVDSKKDNYLRNFADFFSAPRSKEHQLNYLPQIANSNNLFTSSRPSTSYQAPVRELALLKGLSEMLKQTNTGQKLPERSLDVPDVPDPYTMATSKSSATAKVSDQFGKLVTGLTNLGNSCYMNCVLQCLVATPQLTEFFFAITSEGKLEELSSFKKRINKENRLGTKGAVTITFVKLIEDMFCNQGKYFTPSSFKKIVGGYSPGLQFATKDQQDCIEFLNFILDSLHEDLNMIQAKSPEERAALLELSAEEEKTRELLPIRLASTIEWERYLKLNFSVIVDSFQGQYLSRLQCLVCKHTSTTFNSFSILSLPIPVPLSNSKRINLFDCLNFFTEKELLDGNNKWHCPSCKKFTRLTKEIVITRLPLILIIHFKRFSMNGARFQKLDTFIDYPVEETLDMTSYWPKVGSHFGSTAATSNIPVNAEKEYLQKLPPRGQEAPFKYKLYGVVNHYGNLTTGHYTSYVQKKNGAGQRGWYYFDDARVTPNCRPDKVLNANAYCLFFQRI